METALNRLVPQVNSLCIRIVVPGHQAVISCWVSRLCWTHGCKQYAQH